MGHTNITGITASVQSNGDGTGFRYFFVAHFFAYCLYENTELLIKFLFKEKNRSKSDYLTKFSIEYELNIRVVTTKGHYSE